MSTLDDLAAEIGVITGKPVKGQHIVDALVFVSAYRKRETLRKKLVLADARHKADMRAAHTDLEARKHTAASAAELPFATEQDAMMARQKTQTDLLRGMTMELRKAEVGESFQIPTDEQIDAVFE